MRIKIIIILIIAVFAFSGCSATERLPEEGQTIPENEINEEGELINGQSEDPIETVTISIWNSCEPRERIALMEDINRFSTEHNSINLDVRHFRNREELEDQFEAASLAGAGPEIILVSFDSVQRLAPENVVKEITEGIDYNKFLNGLVEISSYNKKKYIVPFTASDFLLFYYNKSIIEEAPVTFNDIIEYCLENNNPEENFYGFLLNGKEPDWIMPFIGGYGDWILEYETNSLTLDTSSTKKTLDFLNKIFNEDQICPYDISYEEMNNAFKEGKTAMIINGSWAIEEYMDVNLNIGVGRIPRTPDGTRNPTPMVSGLGFMINTNSYGAKYDASMQFINYMISDEVQLAWANNTLSFPAKKEFENLEAYPINEIIEKAMDVSRISRGKPDLTILRVIRDAIRVNSESVMMQNISSDEATLKIQEDAIKLKSGGIRIENPLEEELINGDSSQEEENE